MITEIPRNEWKEFFDNLSRSLDGWETKVELLNPEIGSQTLSPGLPFGGLTLEEDRDQVRIELTLGSDAENHVGHTVEQPQWVMFEGGSLPDGGILDIEDKAGSKTLLTFAEPFPVMVEYETTQIVSIG